MRAAEGHRLGWIVAAQSGANRRMKELHILFNAMW
jgi:hypothetical protein